MTHPYTDHPKNSRERLKSAVLEILTHPFEQEPAPLLVAGLTRVSGLSLLQCARMVHKARACFRRWCSGEGSPIPAAYWALAVHRLIIDTPSKPPPRYRPTPTDATFIRRDLNLTPEGMGALVWIPGHRWAAYETGTLRMPPGIWDCTMLRASGVIRGASPADYAFGPKASVRFSDI